jgi:hypothetical protein
VLGGLAFAGFGWTAASLFKFSLHVEEDEVELV